MDEKLNWQPVESSNVEAVAFEELYLTAEGAIGNLYIQFKGGAKYRYSDVPEEKFRELEGCESVGKWVHSQIKNSYECERL